MAATLQTMAASSLQAPVQGLQTSLRGAGVKTSVVLPALRRSSRIVAQASDKESRLTVEAVKLDATRLVRNASIVAANILLAFPALAVETEKGKIFDFNLTLPIIAVEFLLLMVTLDKLWFKPVGDFMDGRDEEIRQKLVGVRDNSSEIKALQAEAEGLIKAARAETSTALAKMKKETAAELDGKLQASRERIEKELAEAIKNLEEQKKETLSNLDAQVATLSEEIIRKVVPFKV